MKWSRIIISLLFSLILQLVFFPALPQINYGLPYIRNYSAAEYGSGTDNWAILQDHRGVMYFGNNPGVLEYDGVRWRVIPVSNQSLVRSLAMDSLGVIYVGAVGEFGYLSPDKNGSLTYHSLVDKIPAEYREFADVWKTYATSEGVCFQTFDHLFIYDGKGVRVINPFNSFHFSFYVNRQLYITDRGRGLMRLRNDSLLMIPQGEFFSDKRTYAMLPYSKDSILVATREKGMFIMSTEGVGINPFITEADAYIQQNQVYHGALLHNNDFAFATLRGGVVFLDHSGRLTGILNKEGRMQNENVKYVFTDAEGGLWLALDDGISRAEISSPARIFSDISGIKGAISDVIKHDQRMYVASTQGIFYFSAAAESGRENASAVKLSQPEDAQHLIKCFKPHGKINSQGWDLLNTAQGDLLAATTDGVFLLKEGDALPINKEYAFKLFQSLRNPARIFIGTQYGIFSLRNEQGNWVHEGRMEGLDTEIRSIAEDKEGNLFLGMPFIGVARINFCADCKNQNDTVYTSSWGKKYIIEKYDTASGLPNLRWNTVFESADPVYVGTDKGLYTFHFTEQKFFPEPRFGKQFSDGSSQVYCFIANEKDRWIYTANSKGRALTLIHNDEIITKPFKRFYEHEIHTIYAHDPAQLWLGSANGLISYQLNNNKDYDQPFTALIRKVVTGKDSAVFSGTNFHPFKNGENELLVASIRQPEFLIPSLSFELNSVAFEFSTSSYDNESSNRFRWYLEGYDNEWSEWTREAKTHYTNLREGKYRFRLQSQNVYENAGKEAVYEFSILPPWYRTIYAYFFYVVALIGLIYASIKISVRRLEQAKVRLENIVTERTAEIVKQKEKIESQHKQLEHKNKEITDSINYARRIQEAILPSEDYRNEIFNVSKLSNGNNSHFVLFKPKDIVSGDFFWTYQSPGNKLIWAACDCTGHGVPGAFMSMIGNSLLNEIVVENKITESEEILNHLREAIIKSLKQTGEAGKQKDGMDIALCVLDKGTMKLQFSGANNPLWLIRNKEIIALKPDKQPIGYYSEQMKPFTRQEHALEAGDAIYTFTDGYEDQFGGPKKKKFMSKQLRELLVSIQERPMYEQKKILEQTIVDWMGTEEQIDDICVFGVRV